MTKIIIAFLIVGAIAVGGYQLHKPKVSVVESVSQEQATTTSTGKKVPFAAFIKDNGSYQCTVHQAISDMDNSGTVYVSNGDIRGEFSTIAEGRTVNSSIIIHNGFAYTWNDMMPEMAFKMAYSPSSDTSTSGTYMWNAEQIGDYNCKPWVRDEAKFTPPATLKFQSVGRQ